EGAPARNPFAAMTLNDRNFDIVDEVAKVAADLGSTPIAVSLAWVLSRRGVTSAIIGPRSLEQLKANLPGFELTLPDEAISRLNDVSRPADRPRLPRG
ncbi:MAG TPA: aldo/keto reductase, partial [Acidimicrobiales bacterium]|nr:aldo/keto reductase [Acidimicrobiales bacterium]